MKILLHICCGPCSIYPVKVLRNARMDVMGYYYRHNIHPYSECLKRQKTLEKYAESINLNLILQEGYELEAFLRNVIFRENERCGLCYHERLKSTALLAKHGKFDFFSSTLLFSKFQKHEMIRSVGEAVGKSVGINFYYHDFREGWKEGIEESKTLKMYRQQYCGCIYSEKERFYKPKKGNSSK